MSSITLSVRPEFGRVPYDKANEIHAVAIVSGAKPAGSARKPVLISVALDCSGSMSEDGGAKIAYARTSLLKLVDHLTEADTLAVVGFSDTVWTVLPPTRMTAEAKDRARREIEGLSPLQSTNLSGATLQVLGHVRTGEAEIRRAMLFTDGLPTAGETSRDRLVAIAGGRPDGSGLTTFGYGTNHDPELLSSMAKAGGGNFYFVRTPDDAPAFFGRELGGLLSCVAQGVKMTIKAAPGVKILEVVNDLDVKASDDQTEAVVSVDDVYSEERRRILFRLSLPEKSKAVAARPSKVCDVVVEYHDMLSGEPRTAEEGVKIEYVKPGDEDKDSDKEVAEQVAIQGAAKAQLRAAKLAAAGDFAGAERECKTAGSVCRAVGTPMADAVALDCSMVEGQVHSASAFHFAGGEAHLFANARGHSVGRGYTGQTAGLYDNAQQKSTSQSFAGDAGQAGAHGGVQVTGGVQIPAPPAPEAPEPPKGLSKTRSTRR